MSTPQKDRIQIVNENDEIIGHKERGTLDNTDIYRVSALWITNSKGEILLARRHRSKSHHPGMWGPAVAGTVDEGENYEQNIIKEAEEELGLKGIRPVLGPKIKVDNVYHHFTQWYTLVVDKDPGDFTLQEDEVEEVRWISPDALSILLRDQPQDFLPTFKSYFDLFTGKE
ncbi:MAG: NUDIX domain-containing protein [Patescibacteria group bacterium]